MFVVHVRQTSLTVAQFYYSASQRLYMLRQIRPSVRPFVRPSVTLRYRVKTRERRGMRSLPSGSPVSVYSFLVPRMVAGRRPCPGKIWVQRGRPPAKTAEPYIFHLITSALIHNEIRSVNANRKPTMDFKTSHQPRSCVTPRFPKMASRYPDLSFFTKISTKNH